MKHLILSLFAVWFYYTVELKDVTGIHYKTVVYGFAEKSYCEQHRAGMEDYLEAGKVYVKISPSCKRMDDA